jgi:uncharacterized RDD family membrane protein YckC
MTEQQTLPPRPGVDFASQPHAYDPVTRPELFDGVIRERLIAFLVDAIIVVLLWALAIVVVGVLGIVTLGLAWLLYGVIFPVVGLGYNALTIGGPKSATNGQRMMGLVMRTWYGGKVTPLVAAFHALLFWFSLVIFCPVLLWPLFDSRKRCLHDILAGVVVINRVGGV